MALCCKKFAGSLPIEDEMHAEHSSYDTVPLIDYFLWRSVGRNLQVAYLIVDEMHAEHPELVKAG